MTAKPQMPNTRPAGSPPFDSGPLSWVRAEIEDSLSNAKTHLDALASNGGDGKSVQSAALCLHQVAGALSMVNLGAAARLSEEIEKLIASLAVALPAKEAAPKLKMAKDAMQKLSGYLDSLMAGEANRPMTLAASYIALNRARGANDASANELFCPDLSATVPLPDEVAPPLDADALAEAVRQARAHFQAGLLKLLRDKDLASGARTMRDAALAIEALLFNPTSRSFWFTAAAFFDAVANDPAGAGAPAVSLFGKIDGQIKLLITGNNHVPEKLFCDLLLVVGKSAARTALIEEVRDVYRLDDLLAAPAEALNLKPEPALLAALAALREQVQKQKENLLAFASRNSAALEPFAKQAELLAAMAQQMPNRELAQLLQVLGAIGRHVRKTGQLLSEEQALEVASAMLFVESSLENFFRLDAEFGQQAADFSQRLRGAMNGVELPALEPTAHSLGDTMTLRAQTHLLIFQVGREVQINLNTIEAALDLFFRDPQMIAGLAPLGQLFKQMQGALSMLELDEAAALCAQVSKRVAEFASGALPGNGDAAAAVAEGVSALGIYVNGLQQNAADPLALLLPALIRFGLVEKNAKAKRTASKARATNVRAELAAARSAAAPADKKIDPVPARAPTLPTSPAPSNLPLAAVLPAPAPPVATKQPVGDALHQSMHAALDQAMGNKPAPLPTIEKVAPSPAMSAAVSAPTPAAADIAGEGAELQRLRMLVIAQRAGIKSRDQRIQELERQIATLNADLSKAAKL